MPYHASLNVSRLYGAAWSPWMQGAVAPTAGMVPTTGACGTMMGPVANICQSSVPVTRQVQVTQMVPVTTVTPVASQVQPQAYVGAPASQAPMMGKAPGFGQFGKGAMPMGTMPTVPGMYTTDASIVGW